MDFDGAIFDVDGVLVDSPHEQAWRDALRELMEGPWSEIADKTSWGPDKFTSHVYQERLAGRPRMDGARAALEYFEVPDAERRATEYADHKQDMVVRLIEAGEFTAFDDALRFVLAVKHAGIRTAAASSSKNAGLLLGKIRLDEFAERTGLQSELIHPGLTLRDVFDADTSGREFEHGKPAPDIFLAAADELGAGPAACFVVEDAPSGVKAAKAGGMWAIGVARAGDEALLAAERADLVVDSLDDVELGALSSGELRRRSR
ncbi:MAG TPA: HAD-IA family hydrolase [Pseudonocardia sp.]|jgi:beta-phosphoglucomutase-like phosphatase (HAD superfamily)|nr:HAD-IA family hydrolase [Pseudonocardia sp.]